MKRMEYHYVRPTGEDVDELLSQAANDGWTVHTFNRNPHATVVDILLEREWRPGR